MKLVLLSDIESLGKLGDVVDVKTGYGRNYLVPYGKALHATEESLAEVQAKLDELARKAAEELGVAKLRQKKIDGLVIMVSVRTTEEGKLFGSVGTSEIVAAIHEATNLDVPKAEVRLPEGAIRELGDHEITIALYPEVTAVVKLTLQKQED